MFSHTVDIKTENVNNEKKMDWATIRVNKKEIELITFTTGLADINCKTFTQKTDGEFLDERTDVAINAFGFTHPEKGDILIDAGLSGNFYDNPPYGNLGMLVKTFQKMNKVKYSQEEGKDLISAIGKNRMNPKHVFITHLHPDHTSGIPYLNDNTTLYYGRNEDIFYYKVLTKKHVKEKNMSLIDFTEGIPMGPFDKVIDVFGDNSLFAISTKGHTKDHIAYLVNGDKPYLIIGDAELTKETTKNGIYVYSDYEKRGEKDARESANNIRKFLEIRPEIVVCYSHDC
jgi:glyoxylase-like metal-dependent hydrolase (beta-lactamase superfamily II)